MDNMRELNKGAIYKGVGRGVDPRGAGNTRPERDKERTGCGLPDKSCDLLLRGTRSPQWPHRKTVKEMVLWTNLCHPHIHVEASVPQNVTVFGEKAFTEVIKLK